MKDHKMRQIINDLYLLFLRNMNLASFEFAPPPPTKPPPPPLVYKIYISIYLSKSSPSLWLEWSIETNKRSVSWVKPLNQIKPPHSNHIVVWVCLGKMWGPTNLTGEITYLLYIHKQSLMCITFIISSISSIWGENMSGASIVLYIICCWICFLNKWYI